MPTYSSSTASLGVTVSAIATTLTITGPTTLTEETGGYYTYTLRAEISALVGFSLRSQYIDVASGTVMHDVTDTTDTNGQVLRMIDMRQPGTMRILVSFDGATSGGNYYSPATAQLDVTITTMTVGTTLTMTAPTSTIYTGSSTTWYANLTRNDTGGKILDVPINIVVDGTIVKTVTSGYIEGGGNTKTWVTVFYLTFQSAGNYTVATQFAGYTTVETP